MVPYAAPPSRTVLSAAQLPTVCRGNVVDMLLCRTIPHMLPRTCKSLVLHRPEKSHLRTMPGGKSACNVPASLTSHFHPVVTRRLISISPQANTPTDFCFSFRGFRKRGGRTDRHVDGWGLGFFEGKGYRNFVDTLPSTLSPVASLMCTYPIKTRTVIAHVRLATQGKVGLENVHPFSRELWGR